MKRLVVASAALALVGGIAPWNGASARGGPADCIDLSVKVPGAGWAGQGSYGELTKRLTLHRVGSTAVAKVRFVNTGTETTFFDLHPGHPEPGFDDSGTVWPSSTSQLEPGQGVTIRYVTRRTREAQVGDTSEMTFSIPTDDCGVEHLRLKYRVAR